MRWYWNHEIFFGDMRGKTLNGLPGGVLGGFWDVRIKNRNIKH